MLVAGIAPETGLVGISATEGPRVISTGTEPSLDLAEALTGEHT